MTFTTTGSCFDYATRPLTYLSVGMPEPLRAALSGQMWGHAASENVQPAHGRAPHHSSPALDGGSQGVHQARPGVGGIVRSGSRVFGFLCPAAQHVAAASSGGTLHVAGPNTISTASATASCATIATATAEPLTVTKPAAACSAKSTEPHS